MLNLRALAAALRAAADVLDHPTARTRADTDWAGQDYGTHPATALSDSEFARCGGTEATCNDSRHADYPRGMPHRGYGGPAGQSPRQPLHVVLTEPATVVPAGYAGGRADLALNHGALSDGYLPDAEEWRSTLPVPPEVLALMRLNRVLGNEGALSATGVGRLRGIVLDALRDWHRRHPAPPHLHDARQQPRTTP